MEPEEPELVPPDVELPPLTDGELLELDAMTTGAIATATVRAKNRTTNFFIKHDPPAALEGPNELEQRRCSAAPDGRCKRNTVTAGRTARREPRWSAPH